MPTLTKSAVKRVLGPVDESLAAELVLTGASEQELREAKAWLTSDETLVNALLPLPAGRVAELIHILERLDDPDPDER